MIKTFNDLFRNLDGNLILNADISICGKIYRKGAIVNEIPELANFSLHSLKDKSFEVMEISGVNYIVRTCS